MTHNQYDAVVFIPCFQCEKYISRAIESLTKQTFQNFHIILVDDASSDKTSVISKTLLEENFPNRHTLIINQNNIGKSANAYFYLNKIEALFVVILDGDDTIIDSSIFEDFNCAYKNGYDVVWSNYQTSDGKIGHCKPLNPVKSPRSQMWKSSHLFSFRHSLFKNIPEQYFKSDDGSWLTAACDLSIAYPILDQTRRYKYIRKIAYEYTVDRDLSHHNKHGEPDSLTSDHQLQSADCILLKTALPLVNVLEEAELPYQEHLEKLEYCDSLNENRKITITKAQILELVRELSSKDPFFASELSKLI